MKRTPWWIAGALAASVGCGSSENPNERDFPPVAKSADKDAPKAKSTMGPGDGSNLPSSYPRPVESKKAPSKDVPGKTAEATKTPEPKPEAKDVPKPADPPSTKETPKAADPK